MLDRFMSGNNTGNTFICSYFSLKFQYLASNFSCGTRFYDSEFAIGERDATHGPWTVSLGELY